MTTEHKHARILRLIADGKMVQVRHMTPGNGSQWCDMDTSRPFSIFPEFEYREKPKPKVKKYRWVVADYRNPRALSVSLDYYKDLADFNTKNMHGTAVAVQQIDSTMIEVEE